MASVFFVLALAAMGGVVGALFAGLIAMSKGGEKARETSNKMMRWRIILQGTAVLFLLLAWLAR